MYIYESDLIHYGLNLTSLMKKTYQCKGGDIFRIQDLRLCQLHVNNTSLSTINITYFQFILRYLENVQKELESHYQREITYQEIRNTLRNRKNSKMNMLRSPKTKENVQYETTTMSIK